MDTFCLVLTGRLAPGRDGAEAHAALAAAFDMDTASFLAKVWQRAPLIIRQALDADNASAQAGQLHELGAEASVLPDGGPRAWLLRDQHVLGPLPEPALASFARSGDRWCLDGAADWQPWPQPSRAEPTTATPPPLPIVRTLPPSLVSEPAPTRRRRLPWLVAGAVAILLLGLLWLRSTPSAPADSAQAQPYVPRPLQPLPASAIPARSCAAVASAPAASDEDRFLLTGGGRRLTGVAQRKGDTYVAEAVLGYDGSCQPDALQLYVFRAGVYVGTAFDQPLDPRSARLSHVQLLDDRQLQYSLASCPAHSSDCGPATDFKLQLQPGAGGWILGYPGSGGSPAATMQIIDRPPPRYPAEAIRQRHEGTVLLVLSVDADGRPGKVSVDRSSGYPELDQAALEAVQQWRFKVSLRAGAGAQTQARVPVRFQLNR
jgi:TonB family protein